MPLAPIALFVYNRPSHTLRVLEALSTNALANQSVLCIFSDGPKPSASPETISAIHSVREVIRQRKWCRQVYIFEQPSNLGLAPSITSGISRVLEDHQRVIVLEDDIVPSPLFLKFMNESLDVYAGHDEVMSISSFNFFALSKKIPDIFFSQLIDCWGWATWRRGWNLFEPDAGKLLQAIDGGQLRTRFNVNGAYDYYSMLHRSLHNEIDSWDIRWYASGFIHNKLSLYPKISLSRNIGFDGTGVNSGHRVYSDGRTQWPSQYPNLAGRRIENNLDALREFYDYFHPEPKQPVKKFLNKLTGLFNKS